MNSTLKIIFFVCLSVLFTSCKQESPYIPADQSTITPVLADNFNLTYFNAAVIKTGQAKMLTEAGPFTVLVPADAAFRSNGYNTVSKLMAEDGRKINQMTTYHILDGHYDLGRLPYRFNQELISRGGKMYVSKWVKNGETILTINGAVVMAENVTASNGLIQVIDRILEPYTHDVLSDAIASQTELTLFSRALLRAGMLSLLDGKTVHTIFAPNNKAMQRYGFQDLDAIDAADPNQLRSFLRKHIFQDRRFLYDYILIMKDIEKTSQTMLDGSSTEVVLRRDRWGTFLGIFLRGSKNDSDVAIVRQDILAGNGVIHIINAVLQ